MLLFNNSLLKKSQMARCLSPKYCHSNRQLHHMTTCHSDVMSSFSSLTFSPAQHNETVLSTLELVHLLGLNSISVTENERWMRFIWNNDRWLTKNGYLKGQTGCEAQSLILHIWKLVEPLFKMTYFCLYFTHTFYFPKISKLQSFFLL